MIDIINLIIIFSFFYQSSSTFTQLYQKTTADLTNQHIILRYITKNIIYFSVPTYHGQLNTQDNTKTEFDISLLQPMSQSSFYPLIINETNLISVFFSDDLNIINVKYLGTSTSNDFAFPQSNSEIIQMEMLDNEYIIYLVYSSNKVIWIVKVQIVLFYEYKKSYYWSSTGTIITGNFIQLNGYIITGILIEDSGNAYYIFNFYHADFSIFTLGENTHFITSTYTNQIHFRMIYIEPFLILCSITSDYKIFCYSLLYTSLTASLYDILQDSFIQMLQCSSQSYYFPFYKFNDNYAILACNSSPIAISIFNAELKEKLHISSDTTNNYFLFELTPLYDESFYLLGMQTTSDGNGYGLYGDIINFYECSDISTSLIHLNINEEKAIGQYLSPLFKIEFLSLPSFDLINTSTGASISVGDIVQSNFLKCSPKSIGKSVIKYNIINDSETFANYAIKNCIINAFVCQTGCDDCTGDDQNVCKSCKTGYSKATINNIDTCIDETKTEGYYLSNGVYLPCISTCATCQQGGDENNHNCLTCKDGYVKEKGNAEDKCILNTNYLYQCEDFTAVISSVLNTMYLTINEIGSTSGVSYNVYITNISGVGNFFVLGQDSPGFLYDPGTSLNGHTETASFTVNVNGVVSSNTCNIKIVVCREGCDVNCNENNYCTQCKDSSYYSYYDNYDLHCVTTCTGEYKYHIDELKMCYKECPIGKEANSNDECVDIQTPPISPPSSDDITIDIDPDTGNTNISKEEMLSNKDSNILDLAEIGKDIKGDDYIVQVYPTDKVPDENRNVSTIDLGECEDVLRREYDIDITEPLLIYKIDIEESNSITNKVEYSVYSIDGTPLDLSKCKNSPISIEYPIVNADGIDLATGKQLLEENGVDVFDIEDTFFNDICFPYSDEKGNDVILNDRKNDIYQKVDFCSEGCTYQGINYTTNKVICSCDVSNEEHSQVIDTTKGTIKDVFTSINILVAKCYNLLSWNCLKNNIGFWFGIIMISTEIGMIVLLVVVSRKTFYSKLSAEFGKSSPTSQIGEKDYTISTKASTLMFKDVSLEDTDETTIQKDKSNYDFITEKKFIDNNPYSNAVIKDNRNYFIILWEYIREHNIFCRIFLHKTGFELFPLHLSVFVFNLTLSFSLNGLFFSDDEISKKYKGELTYIATLLRSIYSCVLGVVLLQIVQVLMNYSLMLNTLLVEIKEKTTLLFFLNKFLKKVRFKIILIFSIEIVLIIVFWYYMITFCAVYHGSQIEWFKGGWTSFLITILTSFGISFAICILRYCGLTYKSSKVYNCSIYLKQLIIG